MAGASFEKAQGEFARGMASNPHVQNAATEVAAAGVRSAISGDNRKWSTGLRGHYYHIIMEKLRLRSCSQTYLDSENIEAPFGSGISWSMQL